MSLEIAVIQELLLERQENIYKIGVYYQPDQSIITKVRTVLLRLNSIVKVEFFFNKITKDSKMSMSDKISWVGGMMGLFTGFSVISGIEIIYWLWFKVVFNKKSKVAPESENETMKELKHEVASLRKELVELKLKVKSQQKERKNSTEKYFDAIFNDIEAQQTMCGVIPPPMKI